MLGSSGSVKNLILNFKMCVLDFDANPLHYYVFRFRAMRIDGISGVCFRFTHFWADHVTWGMCICNCVLNEVGLL